MMVQGKRYEMALECFLHLDGQKSDGAHDRRVMRELAKMVFGNSDIGRVIEERHFIVNLANTPMPRWVSPLFTQFGDAT